MPHNLVISYDLLRQGKNYEPLFAEIKKLGGWAKVNLSVWFVSSTFTAEQARDKLIRVTDSNDKVFVVDALDNTAAWCNLDPVASDYLRAHWTQRK